MGFLDNMKDRLGLSSAPEWEQNEAFANGEESNITDFDDYNPANFTNISAPAPRSGRTRMSSYEQKVDFTHEQAPQPDVAAPAEPTFLDNRTPNYTYAELRSIPKQQSQVATPVMPAAPIAAPRSIAQATPRHYSSMEVLKPTTYAETEQICTNFRRGKIVVISLVSARPDLAKRVLDFSFGVACALDGTVEKLADKVFVICAQGSQLSQNQRDALVQMGVL